MKTIKNACMLIFCVCFLFISEGYRATFAVGIQQPIVPANPNSNQKSLLFATKEADNSVVYRKDIIAHSAELKKELKADEEGFKTVENTVIKSQEKPNLEVVHTCIREGKKDEARNILSEIFMNKQIPEKQNEIKELLDKLNEALIFSPSSSSDAVLYTVQSGDVLAKIAKKFTTNYELIMRINGKPTTRLNIGERLKILTGKTKILVSKSDFTLTLLLNNHYVKQYRICIGKDDKTPVGMFEVKNKMKEPTWYSPQGGVFPYGHKENILGTRWIGFKDKPNLYGFGIHGTTLPESIGTAASNGCVRMVNSDVEELYDFVTQDTEIIIQ
ncbi:MAG: Protein erfK/srfK precursor [Candidatus Jettenia ecosi]|uniref:Protein erfK/srfK n=1 Tax=Candidatus Jettenia ecosi TaxID=2494326 RepID=A0A533QG04_9BACT|nr:MAG: Protein erfK/srfK precursor [Candidatus Jettenia ecosi]